MKKEKDVAPQRLYRRSTTMRVLDCSLRMVKKLEKQRLLRKVRLGARDVYNPVEDVEKVAAGGTLTEGDEDDEDDDVSYQPRGTWSGGARLGSQKGSLRFERAGR